MAHLQHGPATNFRNLRRQIAQAPPEVAAQTRNIFPYQYTSESNQPMNQSSIRQVLSRYGWKPDDVSRFLNEVQVYDVTIPKGSSEDILALAYGEYNAPTTAGSVLGREGQVFQQEAAPPAIAIQTDLQHPFGGVPGTIAHEAQHYVDEQLTPARDVYGGALKGTEQGPFGETERFSPARLQFLADFYQLAFDKTRPAAAKVASDLLNTEGQAIPERTYGTDPGKTVLENDEAVHLNHALLDALNYDYAQLPDWYREKYLPFTSGETPPAAAEYAFDKLIRQRREGDRGPLITDVQSPFTNPVLPSGGYDYTNPIDFQTGSAQDLSVGAPPSAGPTTFQDFLGLLQQGQNQPAEVGL